MLENKNVYAYEIMALNNEDAHNYAKSKAFDEGFNNYQCVWTLLKPKQQNGEN